MSYEKGHIGFWKGKSFSEEHRKNLSKAGVGKHTAGEFKKGHEVPQSVRKKIRRGLMGNKNGCGHIVTDEEKKRLSERAKRQFTGKPLSEEQKTNISKGNKGKKMGSANPLFKHGLSKTREYKRNHRKLYLVRRRNGGELTIPTIQKTYEENIKEFGTLTCVYCLKPISFGNDALEHIIPVVKGGTNEYENLAIACRRCNSSKNDKTLDEWIRNSDSKTGTYGTSTYSDEDVSITTNDVPKEAHKEN